MLTHSADYGTLVLAGKGKPVVTRGRPVLFLLQYRTAYLHKIKVRGKAVRPQIFSSGTAGYPGK